MRLIGYIRVSKVGGRAGETFIAPSVQRDSIEHYAAARGHEVSDWIEDLDQPGTRYERPGFQRALEAIERGEADGLAAARLDRFARSVVDGRRALQRLRDAGGSLVLVAEGLDTTTPMGKAMFTILLAFAELEVDRIREGWQVARGRAVERGVHAARAPFGYRRDEAGRLEPDPASRKIALEVFRRRGEGASWREICTYLDDVAPRASGAWPVTTVTRMLRLRTYLGEGENGARHEALIPRKLWEAAQLRKGSVPRFAPAPRLLTGLLRCAGCGGVMTGTNDGRGFTFYRCRGRRAKGVCTAQSRISAKIADGYVEEAFLAWLRAEPPIVVESQPKTETLDEAIAQLEAAEEELAAYRDANLISVIGREAYVAGLVERQKAVDEASARVSSVPKIEQPQVFELVSTWPDLAVDERRKILAAGIESIVVSRATHRGKGSPVAERLLINWRE